MRIAEPYYPEDFDKTEVCVCCGRWVNKKEIKLSCNMKDLYFLGSGFPLYFIFVKHTIYTLLALFMGTGFFDLITNIYGNYCEPIGSDSYHSYLDENSKFRYKEPCYPSFITQTSFANEGDNEQVFKI